MPWEVFAPACTEGIIKAGANMTVAIVTINTPNTTLFYNCSEGYYLETNQVSLHNMPNTTTLQQLQRMFLYLETNQVISWTYMVHVNKK